MNSLNLATAELFYCLMFPHLKTHLVGLNQNILNKYNEYSDKC